MAPHGRSRQALAITTTVSCRQSDAPTGSSSSFPIRPTGRLTAIERVHRFPRLGVLVIAVLLTGCAPVAAQSDDPVGALESRLELCEHVAGEEPYDAQRRAALAQAFQGNCVQLNSNWRAMLAQHPPPDPIGEQLQGLRPRVEQFPP